MTIQEAMKFGKYLLYYERYSTCQSEVKSYEMLTLRSMLLFYDMEKQLFEKLCETKGEYDENTPYDLGLLFVFSKVHYNREVLEDMMTIQEAIDFYERDYHASLSSFKSHEERLEHIKKCATYKRMAYRSLVIWNGLQESIEGEIKEAKENENIKLADSLTKVSEYINNRIHDIEELPI